MSEKVWHIWKKTDKESSFNLGELGLIEMDAIEKCQNLLACQFKALLFSDVY